MNTVATTSHENKLLFNFPESGGLKKQLPIPLSDLTIELLLAAKQTSVDGDNVSRKELVMDRITNLTGVHRQDLNNEAVADMFLPIIMHCISVSDNPLEVFRSFVARMRTRDVFLAEEHWDWRASAERLIECCITTFVMHSKDTHKGVPRQEAAR